MTLPSQQPRQNAGAQIFPMPDDAARIAVGVVVRQGHKHLRPDWLGWLGVKTRPGPPTLHLAFASAWELLVPEGIYERASPLVNALATRRITRRKYRLLRALLIENALITGQPEVTDHVLDAIETQWRRCPLRYLWV
jgi:hypothetical protein